VSLVVKPKALIIGAGIGGLATGNLLQKAGYDVHIYEKNEQFGGRAGEMTKKGFRFDTGPSWYLMPDVFDHYFKLFGLSAKKELALQKLTPAYKVFFESHTPITITGNPRIDRQTFEAEEAGAGDALERYVKEGNGIYQLALKHFLYTNFTDPRDLIKKDILSQSGKLLSLLSTSVHKRVSSFVRAQSLQQILEYPMVFLGSSPFTAPAMYSLMSALDFKEGVYYPKNGIYSIITSLEKIGRNLGVTYHLNSEAKEIVTESGKVAGIRLASNQIIHADIVISNADLHFTETRLLPAASRSYPETYWAKKESGISALLIYLGVKGTLPQLEHHNLFFVDDWKGNFTDIYNKKVIPESASLYVCKPSATDPNVAPKGNENVFVLVPLPTGIAMTSSQKAALTKRFIAQIAQSIDQPDLADRIIFQESFGPKDFETRFHAWQGSALGVSHLLTQSAFWRTPNKSKKVKNLYYVGGNTMPGVGLPMCLISAELVYKRIMKQTRGGPISHITEIPS
jgi:phytoene desaturase